MCSPELLEAADEDNPTNKEFETEVEKVKAMVYFLKSDPNRYGTLHDDLCQSVYRGRDEFPTTVTSAYDLLQHFSGKVGRKASNNNNNDRTNRFRFRKSG